MIVFIVCSASTAVVTERMPNVYTSDTLILVDPQKVPENYVRSTVSGDVRNRLGTLQQQILSATRLQKIIDTLNLYPIERKTMAREDVITKMRGDISVNLVGDAGSQNLEAFRITFRGREPQLVASVANELASLFIDENLKVREQQATGTTEFLKSQLEETRKTLEQQEAKLRDFRMKHIGEMPEQENADLEMMGQLRSQLQLEGEALSRAEQNKNTAQSLMSSQPAGVVELDDPSNPPAIEKRVSPAAPVSPSKSTKEQQLAALVGRGYRDSHPDVRKLKAEIEQEKGANSKGRQDADSIGKSPGEAPAKPQTASSSPSLLPPPPPAPTAAKSRPAPERYANPVLQTQLAAAENDIAKHKEQIQNLTKQMAGYQAKLEAIPVREQQITELVRDYEISKAHYGQLLNNQLSAATASELEVRQKGEKFSILDPAQPAQKPSSPNRRLIDLGGAAAGLALGLLLAIGTEFLGISVTAPDTLAAATGLPVLEVIPIIETRIDRIARRKRRFLAAVSGAAAVVAVITIVAFHIFGNGASGVSSFLRP